MMTDAEVLALVEKVVAERLQPVLVRLSWDELDISEIQSQHAALARTVQINQTKHNVAIADPRKVRAARAHQLLCQLADAIGPTTWNTALAVRMALTGEDAPPAGYERTVAALKDLYAKAPAQNTIWKALRDRLTGQTAGTLATSSSSPK